MRIASRTVTVALLVLLFVTAAIVYLALIRNRRELQRRGLSASIEQIRNSRDAASACQRVAAKERETAAMLAAGSHSRSEHLESATTYESMRDQYLSLAANASFAAEQLEKGLQKPFYAW